MAGGRGWVTHLCAGDPPPRPCLTQECIQLLNKQSNQNKTKNLPFFFTRDKVDSDIAARYAIHRFSRSSARDVFLPTNHAGSSSYARRDVTSTVGPSRWFSWWYFVVQDLTNQPKGMVSPRTPCNLVGMCRISPLHRRHIGTSLPRLPQLWRQYIFHTVWTQWRVSMRVLYRGKILQESYQIDATYAKTDQPMLV